MKFNPVISALAICICALIAYGFYSFSSTTHKELLAAGSFIFLSATLLFAIGMRYGGYGSSANGRTVSLLFFGLAFVLNLVFSFIDFTVPAYIVVHGILLLVYILGIYLVTRRRT